jgi:hypothetical protein
MVIIEKIFFFEKGVNPGVRSLAYTVGLPKRHPLPPKLKKTRKRKKGWREKKR